MGQCRVAAIFRTSLVERVAEWPKQWLREGREQGLTDRRKQGRQQGLARGREQGLTEGVDQQRALLCRLAAARFDAATAARLAELLAAVPDPERLAEVGERLLRCATAAEFLASLDPARLPRRLGVGPSAPPTILCAGTPSWPAPSACAPTRRRCG